MPLVGNLLLGVCVSATRHISRWQCSVLHTCMSVARHMCSSSEQSTDCGMANILSSNWFAPTYNMLLLLLNDYLFSKASARIGTENERDSPATCGGT